MVALFRLGVRVAMAAMAGVALEADVVVVVVPVAMDTEGFDVKAEHDMPVVPGTVKLHM